MEADVDAHLRRQLLQLRTEVARVRRGRDRDLEDHGVDGWSAVADQSGGEVDDVDARLGDDGRDAVDDPRLVGAVHGHAPRLARDGGSADLLDLAHGHHQVERGGRRGQRRLEVAGGHVGRALDDEHHGEVAAEDGHRRVLEVAPELEEHAGDGGDDPGPVGPDSADREERHERGT